MLKQKTQKKDNYKAVIIGAGRIASTFDSKESKEVLTHAHAYFNHPKVDLLGFFDVDESAAKRAGDKWNCTGYNNLDIMLETTQPDIVSICTPDEVHYENLIKSLEYKPRIVICEKPITKSIKDTKKIIDLYKKNGVPILVNYSRRFDKTVQTLKKNLYNGKYGEIISASGIYTKGILHNGSHLIDLCCYLFGEYKSGSILHEINDYDDKDKTVAGFLSFKNCSQFHLMTGDEREYSIFELDIILEKARIRFVDFGFCISVQSVISDPLYEGYQCLNNAIEEKTHLKNSLNCLVNNALAHLENNEPLLCSLEDAFETQKICFSLLKQ